MSLKDNVSADDFRAFHVSIQRLFKHFDDRGMSINEMRVVSAVAYGTKDSPDGVGPKFIAKFTGMTVTEITDRLPALVESKHLAEIVPLTGPLIYRVGASAGSLRKAIRKALTENC